MSAPAAHDQFIDILKSFSTCMFVSGIDKSCPHGRPMMIADATHTGEVYLASSIDSAKVKELAKNPSVLLTLQSKSQFVSLQGKAIVSQDPGLINQVWTDTWKVWFPKGKSDPDLCILKIEPSEGEFWDQSGSNGIKYLFKSVSALVDGTRPAVEANQHSKISF